MNAPSEKPGQAPDKVYLGDGAYARFDGWGVWLTTENGIQVTNEVYLEPEVWDALRKFIERVTRRDR